MKISGWLSANPELAAHAAAVFNELTAGIPAPSPGKLLVAPHDLRERMTALIRREAEHARAGRPCGIHAKLNQLQDPQMVRELYAASLAGVPIILNVRGLCCLRAGVPGLSPTIKVYSTLGRFLEHSRIYRFENGGTPEFFIGSADLMTRNLSRRMAPIAPVCDPVIQAELETILRTYEQDNCSAWDMHPDGTYIRRLPAAGEARHGAQQTFLERSKLS
jgi:polyphosphate kinase